MNPDRRRQRILALAADRTEWMTALRRRLHRIPETAFQERKTAALIEAELRAMDLIVHAGVAGTGLFADRDFARLGPCIALRADMDALAVHECSDAEYRSEHDGFSHACGHDGHVAAVLGAAAVLDALAPIELGRVRLIFQPAEERAAGAKAMIQAGVLNNPVVDGIVSLHGWPGMDVGDVASRPGEMMAASDSFVVRIFGRGGHSARPDQASSPLPGMARVIEALTAMNSTRRVVTPCIARAGRATNVIPEHAELRGTVRTLGSRTRERTLEEIELRAAQACRPLGLETRLELHNACPEVRIDEGVYATFHASATALLGEHRVHHLDQPSMGSEDFGFYLAHCPGLMFRLGVGKESPTLHNPSYDFNDAALVSGAAVLADMAVSMAASKLSAAPGDTMA